jgi:hypothetical protein
MKRSITFRTLAILLAAALGYAAAGLVSPGPSTHSRIHRPAPPPKLGGGASWSRALAQVRQVAPSRSEEAWVLWADGVPERDIPAAVAALDGSRDFVALQVLLARWALTDAPAGVRSWKAKHVIPSLGVPMDTRRGDEHGLSILGAQPRKQIGSALLKAWSSRDSAEAARFAGQALKDNDPDFYSWDLKSAAPPLLGATGETARFAELVKANPQQAATEALALPSVARQAMVGRVVMAEWMKTDPAAAEAWYRAWPKATQSALMTENFDYAVSNAPADTRARLWAERLPPLTDPQTLAEAPIEATRSSFGTEPVSEASIALIEWARDDAVAARTWVEGQPSPAIRNLFTGHLAGALVGQGRAEEAVALVNALPAEGQPLALRALVNGWIAVDATAALAWAERIDDSTSRDACLSAVVGSTAPENPEWAMKVVEKIGDTTQRDQATTTVINSVKWSQASNKRLLEAQGFPME